MGVKWLARAREVGGGGGGKVLFLILVASLLFPAAAKIPRDPAQVRAFKQQNACPATGKIRDKCPGYVVDHIIPLCAGGDDAPSNMQWQDYKTSLLKDQWERQLCTWQRHRPSPNCAPPPPRGTK